MSDQNQTPIANQHYSPQVPHSFQNNDEIDLRELFKVLWSGKWVITTLTVLFAVAAVVFALKQPNIYQSQTSFVVENSFYGTEGVSEPSFTPQFFTGGELRNLVVLGESDDKSKLNGVSVSYDKRNKSISISKASLEPQTAFDGVMLFSRVFNQTLKTSELDKVNVLIEALVSQSQNTSDKTKDYIDELLAQQLFKKALLENPNSKLVRQINEPVKPTSHIKPKRALIIALGTLLGGMLGVAIVLVRFAFRRKDA
ncbi:Wzz/FepE/Etk N-terminal domain-containing protein [Vibrio brasiliensis]|uniref:Wzz/FepE/Etk N-terminal domain-containing protein n=1 Tax=Vibrio brasiliensis TaxID=170652 RepID=UPI001EFE71E1|nr:Wzz/FepE/Etk N-terminal domain-containing protein [Vibrio brasiliensis]